jgi:hypothetical protein
MEFFTFHLRFTKKYEPHNTDPHQRQKVRSKKLDIN